MAMSLNGFAVVSDLPENREVLHGTCAMFPSGKVNALSAAIQFYADNPSLVEVERQRTREIVAKFYSWERIAEQYLDMIDRMTPRGSQKEKKAAHTMV